MLPVLHAPDPCLMHTADAQVLHPPSITQTAPGLMGPDVKRTLLADVSALPDGSTLRLPAQPQLEVLNVILAPGESLPPPHRLAQRHAWVQSGVLQVSRGGTARPERRQAGEWVIDVGRNSWSAEPAPSTGPVRLLVVQHLWRGPEARANPRQPATARPGPSRPAGAEPVLRESADYTGQPIGMPDGPMRVMVHRYEIAPGATLAWHLHPYQRYAYVERGRLQVEDRGGHHKIYEAGQMLVEQRNVVHRGINLSDGDLSLVVFDYTPQDIRNNTVLAPSH